MRIRIAHTTTYSYEEPVRIMAQVLRLNPRDCDSQLVTSWRLTMSADGRMRMHEDPFGNIVQTWEAEEPLDQLTIQAEGTVDTFDTAGVLRNSAERLPVEVYMRGTELTQVDAAMSALVNRIATAEQRPFDRMHMLLAELHGGLEVMDDASQASPIERQNAAETFAAGKGLPRDLAHVFIACARHLDMPARMVTGYVAGIDPAIAVNHLHAWAEAHVDGFGWIGCDVAAGNCADTSHVRLAIGLDYADVTPVRGARKGGGLETMSVLVNVASQQ
jgi:transglutaminase-like putative cysteine protease